MEKRYWLDVDNEIIKKAKESNQKIITGILFEYPLSFGKSEYGLISEVSTESFNFVHTEMWVTSPEFRTK